ncbi:MAG: redoxin domain-containing protein [Chitinophagales bacterium]|nr:redoxin domain-containing protein [Chitinophagales bacterium]
MLRVLHLLIVTLIILSSCGNTSASKPEEASAAEEIAESAKAQLTTWTDEPEEDLTGDYNIQVKINGFDKGSVRLIGIYGKQNYMADSTRAKGGEFTFSGEKKLNSGMYFILFPGNNYFQLLIDEDQDFKVTADYNNFVQTMKVEGSLTNQLFYQNLNYERIYRSKLDSIQKKYNALGDNDMNKNFLEKERDDLIDARNEHIWSFQEKYPGNFFTVFKTAGQNPDIKFPDGPDEKANEKKFTTQYRNAFWDNVDFADRRLLRTPVIHNKLDKYFDQLIDRVPDSLIKYADYLTRESMADKEMFKYVSNYIGVRYKESKVMGGEAVFVHMIDNFWTPELAFWSNEDEIKGLKKEAAGMKPSLLGKKGQNITCFDPEGNEVSLYDLDKEILVLYIYSYECENCRKETPKVFKIHQEWKDKGVGFYALCMDHKADKWANYIEKNKLTWTNAWDPDYRSGYHVKYHVDITPELYVLDGERIIRGKNLKADQLPMIFDRIRKESKNN